MKKILVTGGAGYVGSKLVSRLIDLYDEVIVYDTFWYLNPQTFQNSKIRCIEGDIRNTEKLSTTMNSVEAVIHLASISNDPSFDLNPVLGKSINYDCFENIVKICRDSGVKRFVFASSSSVYGIKEVADVTEELELNPLTDYSKYKMLCEKILNQYATKDFSVTSLRPATVCGVSPRQRLDVIVNILTAHAYYHKKINVFGGAQKRPNIHIDDMCEAYLAILKAPIEKVNGEIFNVGSNNHTVNEIADMVKNITGVTNVSIKPTDDNRSYHINSQKIFEKIGFRCKHSVNEAIADLVKFFSEAQLDDPCQNSLFHNVRFLTQNNIR